MKTKVFKIINIVLLVVAVIAMIVGLVIVSSDDKKAGKRRKRRLFPANTYRSRRRAKRNPYPGAGMFQKSRSTSATTASIPFSEFGAK